MMSLRSFVRRTGNALLVVLLLCGCGRAVRADDWPSAFHDSANTCVSSEAMRLPLSLAWTTHAAGYAAEYPVAANGLLFVPGNDGLLALRLADGARVWNVPGAFHGAYLAGGTLYTAKTVIAQSVSYHHLLAIETETGKIRWEVDWKDAATAEPRLIAGITGYRQQLFVIGDRSQLVEVDPDNGAQVRSMQFPSWSMGLPAFADEYACWGGSHVISTLSLADWKLTTWGTWDGGNSFPIIWNGCLAIQGPILSTQVYRLQDGKPELLYRVRSVKGVGHGIAPVGDGLLLSRSDNPAGYLAARSLAGGALRWQAPMDVTGLCSATRDYVYVCGQNRIRDRRGTPIDDRWQPALFILRARDGHILSRHPLPASGVYPPLITAGRVVVVAGGEVRCYAQQ